MESPEYLSGVWERLSPISQLFINGLIVDGQEDQETISRYAHLLLEPNASINRKIRGIVNELNNFMVDGNTATHPKVRQGYVILNDFVQRHQDVRKKTSIFNSRRLFTI